VTRLVSPMDVRVNEGKKRKEGEFGGFFLFFFFFLLIFYFFQLPTRRQILIVPSSEHEARM